MGPADKQGVIMKRSVVFLAVFILAGSLVFPQSSGDFSLHLRPGAELPLGSKSALFVEDANYLLGGSAELAGQYFFPWAPSVYFEGSLNIGIHPTQASKSLTLTSAGVGLGYDLRLFNRTSAQIGAQTGVSIGLFEDSEAAGNPFLGGSLAMTVDLSPGLALSLGGTYSYHLGWDEASTSYTDLYQGLKFWTGAIFRMKGDSGRQRLNVAALESKPLFPVFFGYYENNPFGSISIQNHENSAITNVDVYFHISEYMEQPKLTASFPSLGRNQRVTAPLTALFTGRLMNITESTKLASEVRVDYTYLGKRFTYTQPLTVTVLDRNSMSWDDDRKAASFVTPRDPSVLIFSKNTAGLIRDLGDSPLSLNLRIAMGVFETLRLYGLNYVIDPQSSFIEASQNEMFVDFLQFPSQTLIYRAGDCDDMSILYAALLESVGIETAFITVPGHIYMAFSLDMSESEARKTFTSASDFIYHDDKTWVPVEVTTVQDGFLKSFRTGVKQWREAVSKNAQGFFPIHSAWELFPPVGFTTGTLSLLFPSVDAIKQSYKTNLDGFVAQEIQHKVELYESQIRKEDRASTRNSFGILYAKYGLLQEAEKQFLAALRLDRNSVNGMINLANLYYLQKRMDEALTWYKNAASIVPDNPLVLVGLARTLFDREDYSQSQSYYSKLVRLNPSIAGHYSYLGSGQGLVARASSALDRGKTFWEGEE